MTNKEAFDKLPLGMRIRLNGPKGTNRILRKVIADEADGKHVPHLLDESEWRVYSVAEHLAYGADADDPTWGFVILP